MNLAAIRSEVKRLRQAGSVDAAIEYLKDVLNGVNDFDERGALVMELQAELIRAGRLDEYSEVVRSSANDAPHSPSAQIALAEHLLYTDSLQEALEISQVAVAVAKRSRQLVRYALTTRGRVERALGRYGDLEKTLLEMLANEYPTITADIPYEVDLVDGLPVGAISDDVIQRYRRRASR